MAHIGRGFPARPLVRRILPAGAASTTLAVATGIFTLAGQAVGFTAARRLPVANGSYALTGQSVGLRRAFTEAVAPGTYTLTGQTVALRANRRIAVANGSYALNGQSVALRVARTLPLANASYVLSGQAVRLAVARRLALANGVYSLTGQAVTLTKNSAVGTTTLVAGVGLYALTGKSVALRALRRMAVAAGVFTITAQELRLAVVRLDDLGTQLPSRGIVERRFGAIRTRNRPASAFVQSDPQTITTGNASGGWSPLDSSGAGLALTLIEDACRFVRAAGLTYAFFAIVMPATGNTAPAAIGGLPVIARETTVPVAPVTFSYLTVDDVTGIVVNGATQFNLFHTDGSPVTNAALSGAVLRGCAIYEAAT